MNPIDDIQQFIYKYYIQGIVNDTSYNPVDTITYAIILVISIFGILKLLGKLRVRVDEKFIAATAPFIIAGSSLRVMEDANIFSPPGKYLFITPIIFFLIFGVTLLSLVFSLFLEKHGKIRDPFILYGSIGTIWIFLNLALLFSTAAPDQPAMGVIILGLGTFLALSVYIISYRLNFSLLTNRLNISILGSHLLDASSTFVGMDLLGYYEKHVVPTFLINLTGTASIMYPLKLGIFIPALYLLDNHLSHEDTRLKNLMKLAILVLGLAPAIRNTLRIILGI